MNYGIHLLGGIGAPIPRELTVVKALKEGTALQHRAIEGVVPLLDPHLTWATYADYLQRLLPFYAAVEARLKSIHDLPLAVRDIDQRWKIQLLAEDLRDLGRCPEAITAANPALPQLQTLPQALGCLYVLEGSTLGAEILVKVVRKRLGDAVATQFLASYGAEVGDKWRSLCAAIEAAIASRQDREIAIASAQATFASLHAWLEER